MRQYLMRYLLRFLGLGGIILSFGFLGRFLARALGLSGWQYWTAQGVFIVAGIAIAWLCHLFLRGRSQNSPLEGSQQPTADLDGLWEEAKARLRQSSGNHGGRIGRAPALLTIGTKDGAKTTSFLNSELNPELLSGSDQNQGEVVPTRGINTWYGSGWLMIEASQDVLGDESRWAWMTKALRPDRLSAAFAGARQAPRAVLLCYPTSQLLTAGAALREEAQSFRSKLTQLSESLGVNVPVYVLFTKLDQISNFTDYTRNFNREDAQEVLGSALSQDASNESYNQVKVREIGQAFDSVVHVLSIRRTDLLQREASEKIRVGAYEFPREFSKIRAPLIEFLVELGQPTRLSVGPFLRGFYFTGVRPVVMDDHYVAMQTTAPASPVAAGATMVFNPSAPPGAPSAPQAGGPRRVPQWTFLPRLIQNRIFKDHAALAVTESGARVNALRRGVLIASCVASILLMLGFTTSYVSNRNFERSVIAAAVDAVESPESPIGQALADLDALGNHLATLRMYEDEGPPLRRRWGLYPGSRLLAQVYRVYFTKFDALLGRDVRDALFAELRTATRTQDPALRSTTYKTLKAYLMTHGENARATESFLPDELLRHFVKGAALDPETEALVTRQFHTYARELRLGNPYLVSTDSAMLTLTRSYLEEAATDDRFYQAITSSVSAGDVSFSVRMGGQTVVSNRFVVPGAYTREGWGEVSAQLSGNLISDEDWVVAATPPSPENIDQLRALLWDRYRRTYVNHWQDFLAAGSVSGLRSTAEALETLQVVGDRDSPLLQMIGLVSEHTAVDSLIAVAFTPAHYLVPPPNTPSTEALQPYLEALNILATTLRSVGTSQGDDQRIARAQATTDAGRANQAVARLVSQMPASTSASATRRSLRDLLESPINRTNGILRGLPAGELNGYGAAFCRDFGTVTREYPFNSRSTADIHPDEVGIALGPGSSTLWNFHASRLEGLITRVGRRYRRTGGTSLRPTDQFVQFFDRAARVSDGLFPDQQGDIEIVLSINITPPQGVDEITIDNNGARLRFSVSDRGSETLFWVPDPASQLRILARVGDRTVPVLDANGTWALFRLFQDAVWGNLGDGAYSVTWNNTALTAPLSGRVTFAGSGINILDPALVGGLSCVPQIVR